jgi:hypothetical protein
MVLSRSRFFMKTIEQQAEFEPEMMQSMIDALAKTGRMLRLSDRQPGLAVVATRQIIEFAKSGEREAERLTEAALNALRH